MAFYPLAATVISAAFSLTLWAQYRTKRRPYLLAWTIALAVYAVAALTEVSGAATGWSPGLFRVYYFFGGILVVGILALGTVSLLAPHLARRTLWTLLALAMVGLIGILGAQLNAGSLQTHGVPPSRVIPVEGGLFNIAAIAMAVVINLVGSVVLIGGALWSAYGLWRRGMPASRLLANVLIAAGALIVAGASSLTRLGIDALFYVGQAVGVLVMFVGFLAAQRQPARSPRLTPVAKT